MPIEFNDAAFVSALKAGRVGEKVDEMRYENGWQKMPGGEIFTMSKTDGRLGDQLNRATLADISTITFSCLVTGDQIQYGAMIADPAKYQANGNDFVEFKSFDQLVRDSKISAELGAVFKAQIQSEMKPKMVAANLATTIPKGSRVEQRTSAVSGGQYSVHLSDPKDGITREDYPSNNYAFTMKNGNLEYQLMYNGDVFARRNSREEFAKIESIAEALSKDQVLDAFNNPTRVAQASTSRTAPAASRAPDLRPAVAAAPPAPRAAPTPPQQPPQGVSVEASSEVVNAIQYYRSVGNSTPVDIGGVSYLVTGAEYKPGSQNYVAISRDGSDIRPCVVKKEGGVYTMNDEVAPNTEGLQAGLMFDRLVRGHRDAIDAATKYYSDYSIHKSKGMMTMADGVEKPNGTYAITNLKLGSEYIAIFTPEDFSKRPIACVVSSNSDAAFIVGQQPSADSERTLFNGLASAHQGLIRGGHVAPVAAVPSRAEIPAARGAGLAITAPTPRVGDPARGPAAPAPVAAAAFDAGHGAVVDSTRAPAARPGAGGAIPRLVRLDVPVETVLAAGVKAKKAIPGDKRIDATGGRDQEVLDADSKYFSLGNVGEKEMAIQYRSDDTMFLVSKEGNVYKPCKMNPTNPDQAAEFNSVFAIAVKAMDNLKALMATAEAARPAAAPHAPISARPAMSAEQAAERVEGAARGGGGRSARAATSAVPGSH